MGTGGGAGRVAVVGAGVGGLAAALDLAARGLEVVVLERAPAPGGKMREVQAGGARLDAGPTVFTMRRVFESLFADAGARLCDHLSLRPAGVLARHAWSARERLDLHADPARTAEAIGRFSGPAEAARYLGFVEHARRVYRTLEGPFIRAPRPTPASLAAAAGAAELWRTRPFSTLWTALGSHFHDPRLRQLFGRYATYLGSSPFLAPATLMLVAHVEQEGVWMVEGGMHRVASALATLAERHGARFHYGAEVAEIPVRDGRATGVRLASGEWVPADAVVVNADPAALGAGLLGRDAAGAGSAPGQRSLSALTWALHARAEGFPLVRHNVFFGPDYAGEFDALFRRGRLPDVPTVYVCAQDRGAEDRGAEDRGAENPGAEGRGSEDGPAPDGPHRDGPERLFCLVNAPPTGDRGAPTPQEIARCEERAFGLLERCGLLIHRRPEATAITGPTEFARLFPGTGGALYGRASHGWTASFARPGARTRIAGLYLAGGGTHPGPGVPMAALSGRMAAASLVQDLASTGLSRRTATPGGTWTRSATTDATGSP